MLVVVKTKKTVDPTIQKIKGKINIAKKNLSKAQEDLTYWKTVADTYSQLFQKYIKPELERFNEIKKTWVLKLFEVRNTMKWSRNEKQLLDEEIISKVVELLDEMPGDSELEAIYKKYQEAETALNQLDIGDFDETFLQMLAEDICAESNLPKDFFKGCKTEQSMYERFTRHMNEQQESTRAQHQPSVKHFEAGVIKTLYRRLASLLHPDKESDPLLKIKKTELMQRLNNAYRNNDVDELMNIQKEIDLDEPMDLMNNLDGLTANLQAIKMQHKELTAHVNEIKQRLKAQVDPDILVMDPSKLEYRLRNSFKRQVSSIKHEMIQLESDINYTFIHRKGVKHMLGLLSLFKDVS